MNIATVRVVMTHKEPGCAAAHALLWSRQNGSMQVSFMELMKYRHDKLIAERGLTASPLRFTLNNHMNDQKRTECLRAGTVLGQQACSFLCLLSCFYVRQLRIKAYQRPAFMASAFLDSKGSRQIKISHKHPC